jgi:hypothetical protein
MRFSIRQRDPAHYTTVDDQERAPDNRRAKYLASRKRLAQNEVPEDDGCDWDQQR